MNRKDILKSLRDALSFFSIHPRFIEEIVAIIQGSGYEVRFFKLFFARLEFLSRHGINSINIHEELESIGNGLYSMHVSAKGFNIRILYAFFSDATPVLLIPFEERAGKKISEYSKYIGPARERFLKLSEEGRHE